jgi:hypothetical protein
MPPVGLPGSPRRVASCSAHGSGFIKAHLNSKTELNQILQLPVQSQLGALDCCVTRRALRRRKITAKMPSARIMAPPSGKDQPNVVNPSPESPSQASIGPTSGRLTQHAAQAAAIAPAAPTALVVAPTLAIVFSMRSFLSRGTRLCLHEM